MRTCHPGRSLRRMEVLNPSLDTIRFNARFQGALTVNKGSDGLRMNFPALIPRPLRNLPAILYRALGQGVEVVEVAEVNQTYIATLGDEGAVRNLHPDLALLEQLHPFVAAVTAPGENADFVIGRGAWASHDCRPASCRNAPANSGVDGRETA